MGAAKVNNSTAGKAAVVDYITIGRAVGVNYSAAGGSSKISVNCG